METIYWTKYKNRYNNQRTTKLWTHFELDLFTCWWWNVARKANKCNLPLSTTHHRHTSTPPAPYTCLSHTPDCKPADTRHPPPSRIPRCTRTDSAPRTLHPYIGCRISAHSRRRPANSPHNRPHTRTHRAARIGRSRSRSGRSAYTRRSPTFRSRSLPGTAWSTALSSRPSVGRSRRRRCTHSAPSSARSGTASSRPVRNGCGCRCASGSRHCRCMWSPRCSGRWRSPDRSAAGSAGWFCCLWFGSGEMQDWIQFWFRTIIDFKNMLLIVIIIIFAIFVTVLERLLI